MFGFFFTAEEVVAENWDVLKPRRPYRGMTSDLRFWLKNANFIYNVAAAHRQCYVRVLRGAISPQG